MAVPWPEGRLEALRAWLTANNIQPGDVPLRADLYLDPGPDGTPHIHYEAFHLDSNGLRQLDERSQRPAIERRTTPLLVDPPDWWEPHRKPTRDQLLEAVDRVQELHRRNEHTGDCEHCSVTWPCATIHALNTKEPT